MAFLLVYMVGFTVLAVSVVGAIYGAAWLAYVVLGWLGRVETKRKGGDV